VRERAGLHGYRRAGESHVQTARSRSRLGRRPAVVAPGGARG
jgi:hypothetical protein